MLDMPTIQSIRNKRMLQHPVFNISSPNTQSSSFQHPTTPKDYPLITHKHYNRENKSSAKQAPQLEQRDLRDYYLDRIHAFS